MPKTRDTCAVCGNPIKPPKRAYCSKDCMTSAQTKREAEKKFQSRIAEMAQLEVEDIDDGEEWRPIAGYEGEYDVSNYGRVRSRGFIQEAVNGRRILMKPRLLTQQKTKDGYMRIEISKQGRQKKFAVHRLVANAFISNPENKPQVNHIDSDRANNKAENLEWVTASENAVHACKYGFANPDPKLMTECKRKPVVREDGEVFPSARAAAKAEGLSAGGVEWHLRKGTAVPRSGLKYQYVEDMEDREVKNLEIRVKMNEGVKVPRHSREGDAGLDLTSLHAHVVRPHERVMVSTGFRAAIPTGFFGMVVPRSGVAWKRGLTLVNSPGIIDSNYRGEILLLMLNTSNENQTILAGERIAQILILPHETVSCVEVDELPSTERGDGGFGSSGAM